MLFSMVPIELTEMIDQLGQIRLRSVDTNEIIHEMKPKPLKRLIHQKRTLAVVQRCSRWTLFPHT